jgi:2-dehydro-3-deoxygluconokinase
MTRAVCIGECMVELRAQDGELDSFARAYAGDAYNTAVYFKRSFPAAQVQFLTATGDDAVSHAMRGAWAAQGIDVEMAFTISGATPGLYLIETDAAGERRFQYWRKDSAAKQWLARLLSAGESTLWGADLIYFSGISLAILSAGERTQAISLLRRLQGHVGRIAFDPNLRLSLWENHEAALLTISEALDVSDIALPSSEDLHLLFDVGAPQQQLKFLESRGTAEVALTLGADGCVVSAQQKRAWIPALAAPQVIDTSGAGDSFNGAYLAARLQGASLREAAESGMAVASRVVGQRGAIVPAAISHPQRMV